MARRAPADWVIPGPPSAEDASVLAAADEDLSYLSGHFRIFQKKRGHRWSLDDLVTAHFAVSACRVRGVEPEQTVDLGCGIGSVLLMTAWSFPRAHCHGVEVQATSAGLAQKSVTYNGVGERVSVTRGDLRDAELPHANLVTGTPPYFPEGTGTFPVRAQAPGALFELAGGPEYYVRAAARILKPGGIFALCGSVLQERRVFDSLHDEGFHVARFQRVIPREGKAPLLCLWTATREATEQESLAPLVVRDDLGQWTSDFIQIRRDMGLPTRPPTRMRP